MCGWCAERPTVDGSRLCSACAGGLDTASIGVPISDADVRAAGFAPTARGWVPKSQELRDRLEAADKARTAEREAEDDLIARVRQAAREVLGR